MKLLPAPTPELERLRWERVARFKRTWRAYLALGYVDTLRRQNGRDRLIEQVRAEIQHALYPVTYHHPAPPMTGRNLPGPANTHPYDAVTPEQVQAYIDVDPFVREGLTPRMAADLAYFESFNPKRRR